MKFSFRSIFRPNATPQTLRTLFVALSIKSYLFSLVATYYCIRVHKCPFCMISKAKLTVDKGGFRKDWVLLLTVAHMKNFFFPE